MQRKSKRVSKRTKKPVKRPARAKIKLPRAFRITPMKVKFPRPKHAHLLGAAGLPPCPGSSKFWGYLSILDKRYCVYLDGADYIYIECPL